MAAIVRIGRRRNQLPVALIVLLLAVGIAVAAWIGMAPVVEHFEQLPQNEPLVSTTQGRVAAWNDTLKLVRAHPWTGVGLGCFQYAFTAVQSTQLTYLVDHAHNDYLELAAELGLPCAVLFIAGIFWMAGSASSRELTRAVQPCSCACAGLVWRNRCVCWCTASRTSISISLRTLWSSPSSSESGTPCRSTKTPAEITEPRSG